MINIEGLNKAEILMELYNNSKVQGLGISQATGKEMTLEEAELILKENTDIDYLNGKAIKVNLKSDIEIDAFYYDKHTCPGAAKKLINKLKVKMELKSLIKDLPFEKCPSCSCKDFYLLTITSGQIQTSSGRTKQRYICCSNCDKKLKKLK